MVRDWSKPKPQLGNQRTCSECKQDVYEVNGAVYLFKSLGETEKRFVCSDCIDKVKARIQNKGRSFSVILDEEVEDMLDNLFVGDDN